MTDPIPDLTDPFQDRGHEGIRVRLLGAIGQVTATITQLRSDFTTAQGGLGQAQTAISGLTTSLAATQAALNQTRSDLAALTVRVTALEPPPPAPIP